MSFLLERLFGRLPIGWLQLRHNRTRLFAALAGVAFANILVFMQLGFLGALISGIGLPYKAMNADIIMSSSDMNTLADASPLPRQRMFQVLAVPGVAAAVPLYYGKIDWKQPDGTVRVLDTFGVDPSAVTFKNDEINGARAYLAMTDRAIIDRRTRNVDARLFETIAWDRPLDFETKGRTLHVGGTFTVGGGFTADGYLVVSDQTFFKHFPQRVPGAPSHVFITVADGFDPSVVTAALRRAVPHDDVIINTVADTIAKDVRFQTTQRPVGIVFGFGVVIGVLVGAIIVYQVLSSDVADHLREYATLKAIGYRQRFFLGIVLEEALVLAVFGFIPGFLLSLALYGVVAVITGLPIAMTGGRAAVVVAGTLVMCLISGAIATRKLARANPADLF